MQTVNHVNLEPYNENNTDYTPIVALHIYTQCIVFLTLNSSISYFIFVLMITYVKRTSKHLIQFKRLNDIEYFYKKI